MAMESPNKRPRISSPTFQAQDDFVPLGEHNADLSALGANGSTPNKREIRSRPAHGSNSRSDRPKSKHALPGYEPWVLVKTKQRRRFVHNVETGQSLWRIPPDVLPGVRAFDQWEQTRREKAENAAWAEEQLRLMRTQSKAGGSQQGAAGGNAEAGQSMQHRRRRSESLQREDEAALMAELAAQAEREEDEENGTATAGIANLLRPPLQPGSTAVYDSDSSYEEVEVTDSEGEGEDDGQQNGRATGSGEMLDAAGQPPEVDAPVEFGEDDIAHQLAAMEGQDSYDTGEYGGELAEWEGEDFQLSEADAVGLFRDMLNDNRVSPFTPWEKLITDESETSILYDDRYTVLNTMRARKDAWDGWVKDRAAELKQLRSTMEQQDPKIPYLAFLQDKATPKLYWPEFKRKYKREAEMNERKLGDKDREKLYRGHIARIKLPEKALKADLETLLKGIPLNVLNRNTTLNSLPQPLLSHLHYISLPPSTRDPIIESFIRSLPLPSGDHDMTAAQRHEKDEVERRQGERKRREQALAERAQKVDDERRRAGRDEARAKRDLEEEERELQRAMAVNRRGLQAHSIGNV